jgi:hypothetical protein
MTEQPDDSLSAEQAKALDRYLDAEAAQFAAAINRLFGQLPNWLPEPTLPIIRRCIANLRAAEQSDERIVELVALARNHALEDIPGTALDATSFFQNVHDLAHVQEALTRDKATAIKELGGSDAELGNRLRIQRGTFSSRGNASKRKTADEKAQKWLKIGAPIRNDHPSNSNTWLAKQIANKSGDKESTIRAAIPALGLQKKK